MSTYLIPPDTAFSTPYVVMSEGGGGSWDVRIDGSYTPCDLIKKDGTYYLYYIGADGDRGDSGPANRQLGVATSTDGVNFSKSGSNPIITFAPAGFGVEDEEGIFSATILIDGDNFYCYYGGLRWITGSQVDIEIRVQSSTDGISYSNDTLIHDSAGDELTPFACYKNGSNIYVYYTGPLSGGNGDVNLRSGTAWNNLPTDNQNVLTGSLEGGGGAYYLDASTVAMWVIDGNPDDDPSVYTFSPTTPTTLGSIEETHQWGSSPTYKKHTYLLDTDKHLWYMVQRHDVTNDFYMRTARAAPGPFPGRQ